MVDSIGNFTPYVPTNESVDVAKLSTQKAEAQLATSASAKVMDASKTQGENVLNLLQNVLDIKA